MKSAWMRQALYKKQQTKVLTCELNKEGVWNTFRLLNLAKNNLTKPHLSKPKHKSESLSPQKISLSIPLFFSFQLLMSRRISTQCLHVFKQILLGGINFNFQISDFRKKTEKWRVGLVRGNPPNQPKIKGWCYMLNLGYKSYTKIHQTNRGKGWKKQPFHRNCCWHLNVCQLNLPLAK